MFGLRSAPLATCAHLGSGVVLGAALQLCAASARPQQVRPVVRQAAVLRAVKAEAPPPVPDLLPSVKPQTFPLPTPVNCAIEACLALTFDDGPDPRTTPQLLDTLAAHQLRATFFVLGSQAAKHPEIVRRVAEEGHEIGNHSWGHANFTKLSPAQMTDDFNHTQKTIARITGAEPRLFRPPYGARDDIVRQTIPAPLALWNVDPEDWRAPDPQSLAAAILATAKPGGVIVLHDVKPITAAAASIFIPELTAKYRLVTISHLHAITPETPPIELFGR